MASGKQSTHEHYATKCFRGHSTKYKCLENFTLYSIYLQVWFAQGLPEGGFAHSGVATDAKFYPVKGGLVLRDILNPLLIFLKHTQANYTHSKYKM